LSEHSEITEQQQPLVAHASAVLQELKAAKDRLPIAGLIQLILERTAYDASLLTESSVAASWPTCGKLIEMARQFDQAGDLRWPISSSVSKSSISEETDENWRQHKPRRAMSFDLMTIHQSKGLEFPVVVVADMDRSGKPPGSSAELHAELGP